MMWRTFLQNAKPQFYSGLGHALSDGNFWLAVSVALTGLAPNLDKPYSVVCYGLTALAAIYGAALKSNRDPKDNRDAS